MSFDQAFEDFAIRNQGKTVQISLRGAPQPFHGELRPYFILGREDGPPDAWQVVVEAQLGPGAPPIRMPFVFSATDVLWFTTGPIEQEKSRLWGS